MTVVNGPVILPRLLTGYPAPAPELQSFPYGIGTTYPELVETISHWIPEQLIPQLTLLGASDQAIPGIVNEALAEQSASITAQLATVLAEIIAGENVELNDGSILAALESLNSVALDYLHKQFRDAIIIPVTQDATVDYADQIQAALDTGADVVVACTAGGVGAARVTHPLQLSAQQGQRFVTRGAVLFPTFLGETVRLVTRQTVTVEIDGTLQPAGDDSTSYAVRIGNKENGWNPQQGSVAGTIIRNYRGSGFYWDSGAMIDFTHAAVYNATRAGFSTRADGNDNNHGYFANSHAVNCGGAGYAIRGNGADLDNGGSRHHVFSDAKAFGCSPNFYVESRSNGGRVFSEVGVTPDTFTANSRGNDFQYHETAASYEGVVDLAPVGANQIAGYSVNNKWETKELTARAITVGVNQPTNKSTRITEWISGKYVTGAVVIAANSSVTLDPGIAGGGDGRSVDTALFAADPAGYIIQPFFDATGNMKFTVLNTQGTSRTLNGTISYGIKRFA